MEYPISHYFLVRADSAVLAARHVERYLSGNQLISYAEFFVEAEEVLGKEHESFGTPWGWAWSPMTSLRGV